MFVYRMFYLLFSIVFHTIAKIDVTGREYVPVNGVPFILAINHLEIIDTPLAFIAMPVKKVTVFVADKWADNLFVGTILKMADTIFVNREEFDRQALQESLARLEAGGVLGMAPEGTRSRTGGLQRGKPGIAYMASKAKVPILPVGISGQVGFADKLRHFQRLHIRVQFGPLIHLPPVTGANKTAQFQAQVDEVMLALGRLIDPDLRGVYADAIAAADAKDEP